MLFLKDRSLDEAGSDGKFVHEITITARLQASASRATTAPLILLLLPLLLLLRCSAMVDVNTKKETSLFTLRNPALVMSSPNSCKPMQMEAWKGDERNARTNKHFVDHWLGRGSGRYSPLPVVFEAENLIFLENTAIGANNSSLSTAAEAIAT